MLKSKIYDCQIETGFWSSNRGGTMLRTTEERSSYTGKWIELS